MGRRRDSLLARHKAFRQPRRRFTIFSEGKNTEPAYFDALRVRFRDAMIEIKSVGKGTSPRRVAETASAYVKANPPRDSFEQDDQVWVVFDRDTHTDFDQAIALCDGDVRVARSNPCFEVWLILHVEDYDRPNPSAKVEKHLARLRREYDPDRDKCPNCAELVLEVAQAEKRAEAQLERRRRDGAPFGNPSTTVHLLTREIHAAAAASARKRSGR